MLSIYLLDIGNLQVHFGVSPNIYETLNNFKMDLGIFGVCNIYSMLMTFLPITTSTGRFANIEPIGVKLSSSLRAF